MFTERLNLLLKTIGASAAGIARHMGCDRSNINRFVKGQRIPKAGGKSATALVDAVFTYADANGDMEQLCALIEIRNAATTDEVKKQLSSWLFEDESGHGNIQMISHSASYFEFGQRLSTLMKLAGLSNSRLSQLLSIDASYISRFRSGSRSPKSNTKIKSGICAALLERITEQDKLTELADIMNVTVEAVTDSENTYHEIYRWLYGNDNKSSFALEKLVDQIGNFTGDIKTPEVYLNDITDNSDNSSSVYFGIDGLRKAVVRFLSTAIAERPREICLYSDQNMEWMSGDPVYAARWSALMAACIQGGVKINIIHNISRDISEMTDAIKSWLPLYPSGMIKSYYCKRGQDERFSTTLFLNPGRECISGNNVIGTENENGMYRYDTAPELLTAHRQAYNDLLARSGELVKAIHTNDAENLSIRSSSEITVLSSKLSLATMPEDVLSSILNRSQISDEQRNSLRSIWNRQREFYIKSIEKHGVHECIFTVPFSAYEEAPVADLPGLSLSYTKEEYAEHIKSIIILSENYTSYRFYPLPQPIFDNIRIRISREETAVSRMSEPFISFIFEHKSMCDAFISYSANIRKEYHLDKISTRNILQDFMI